MGPPGQPGGAAEVADWRSRQVRHRSYEAEVVGKFDKLRSRFDVVEYGRLDYAPEGYPLFAIKSRDWRDDLPTMLVTGGVHGYETSGVHGALQFVERHAADYAGKANLLVAPCISPWAYERIHRWNIDAIDPNRSFRDNSPAQESAALIALVAPWRERAAAIDAAEYQRRIERARECMRAAGRDALLITAGTSLRYFTGVPWGASERLVAMLLTLEGDPALICPAFEAGSLSHVVNIPSQTRLWEEHEDPCALVIDTLRARGARRLALVPGAAFAIFNAGLLY
ncbi:aminopeptidase P family N-terminal domain-containing protein, partial [Lysobacter sp. 2RAB21]